LPLLAALYAEGETVESFFEKIKLKDHASKFSSWEELFTTKTRVRRCRPLVEIATS
jgi:hypothetical protein